MAAKKYTNKEKAEALKRLQAGESASAVSREMKIPRSTLIHWQKSVEKSVEPTGAGARKKIRVREKNATVSTGGEKSGKKRAKSTQEVLCPPTVGNSFGIFLKEISVKL